MLSGNNYLENCMSIIFVAPSGVWHKVSSHIQAFFTIFKLIRDMGCFSEGQQFKYLKRKV